MNKRKRNNQIPRSQSAVSGGEFSCRWLARVVVVRLRQQWEWWLKRGGGVGQEEEKESEVYLFFIFNYFSVWVFSSKGGYK